MDKSVERLTNYELDMEMSREELEFSIHELSHTVAMVESRAKKLMDLIK